MADFGPLQYMGVRGPEPASYQIPSVDFGWLGNLAQAYQQGEQYKRMRDLQTMFQTPQGRELLTQSGVDPGSLPGALIGAGGAEAAGPYSQRLLQEQIFKRLMRGAPGINNPAVGPQSDAGGANTASASDPRGKIPVIVAAAQKHGVDPATAVRVARSEGLTSFFGDGGKSGGAFQLYTGGGLGNDFKRDTGLDPLDPKNEDATIDYAMMKASQGGWTPWVGARKMGLAKFQGIGQRGRDVAVTVRPSGTPEQSTPAPTVEAEQPSPAYDRNLTPQQIAATGLTPQQAATDRAAVASSGVGTSAPAPQGDFPTPSEAQGGPPFAPMLGSASSPNASGPANIKLASSSNDLSGLITPRTASQPMGAQPMGPTPQDQPPQAPPVQMAQANIPSVAPPPGQDLPTPEYRPEVAARYRAAARDLRNTANRIGFAAGGSGLQVPTKAYEEQANEFDKKADQIEKFLADQSQKRFGVGIEGQTKQQEAAIKNTDAQYRAIAAKERDYTVEQKGLIDTSRAILNTPGIYTGIGGEQSHDMNKVRAVFGDTGPALLQDMLNKITAASVLNTINSQKLDMAEAGGTSSRIFAQQVDQVAKASPSLQTTVAGNRALVEIQDRIGKLNVNIAEMARDYRKNHQGLLDDGWDGRLAAYMKSHPVFNDQERNNPLLIGVASIPAGMENPKTGKIAADKVQDFKNWAGKMGIKHGDPIRAANGNYIGMP